MAARTNPGPGFGFPPPDTGNFLLNWISRALVRRHPRRAPLRPLLPSRRRQGPPRARVEVGHCAHQPAAQGRGLRRSPRSGPSRTRRPTSTDIIASFNAQIRRLWNPGHAERGGNTKTHGIVRAEFIVRDDLPERDAARHLRRARAHLQGLGSLRGPRPVHAARHRRRRLPEHEHQADGRARRRSCSTTSSTRRTCSASRRRPSSRRTRAANAQLQRWSYKNAQIFYFLNFRDPHILDSIMQLLWTKTQTSPLEGDVLQLRALPARGGPGDAVLVPLAARRRGRACRACRCARPTTICATRWSPRSRSRTSSSTSCSSSRPIRSGCRSRTTACSGR